MKNLSVLSYNIHKGFSGGVKKYTLRQMREEIRRIHPDIIFLQEVHGTHSPHKKKRVEHAELSQFEYIAHELWPHFSYGKNAVYDKGNHGNAILSRYPIVSYENIDLSTNRFERRGLLHAVIQTPHCAQALDCFCTHLNLSESGRKKQLNKIIKLIQSSVPQSAALILAGDFNDWRQSIHPVLKKALGLSEAFLSFDGICAKSFPSFWPLLYLDRVYSRGLEVKKVEKLNASPWQSLSDHLPLSVEFGL